MSNDGSLTAAEIAQKVIENDVPGRHMIFSGKGMTGDLVHDSANVSNSPDPLMDRLLYPLGRGKGKKVVVNPEGRYNAKLPCLGGCGEDIVQAPGQRVYSHAGQCRKVFKRRRAQGDLKGVI